MERIKSAGLVFLILILLVAGQIGGQLVVKKMDKPSSLGGSNYNNVNILNTVTHSSTSTASLPLPVLVLARNSSRAYAKIANNSATAVNIFLGNFASMSAASTSVSSTAGIRLAPVNSPGFEYDIKPENLYVGDVWASSTLSGLQILTTEGN